MVLATSPRLGREYDGDGVTGVVATVESAFGWTAMAVILTSLPITFLVALQVIRRKWTDLDVSVRKQRYTLYPFGIACMLALTLSYVHFDAPAVAIRSGYAQVMSFHQSSNRCIGGPDCRGPAKANRQTK